MNPNLFGISPKRLDCFLFYYTEVVDEDYVSYYNDAFFKPVNDNVDAISLFKIY